MGNESQKKPESFCLSRVSLRHILGVFALLSVFAVFNLMTSSYRLDGFVDVTMQMKSNVMGALNDFLSYNNPLPVNGTFSMRSFASKNDFVSDYKKWLKKHVGDTNLTGSTRYVSTLKPLINIDGSIVGDTNGSRKDNCSDCFIHNFTYVIDNEDMCKPMAEDQVIRLMIFITTTHGAVEKRNAIRQTWLRHTQNNTGDVRYAFLLGQPKHDKFDKDVIDENNVYHDILKEDFVDTYNNLTFKTIMAFKYAANRCPHVQFVMKTDDDMFVNIPNLLRLTEKNNQSLQAGLGGSCNLKAGPIRNKASKWFASVKSYPNPHYPGFCSGTGYVTSLAVARQIYEISPSVPFFHLEDVYSSLCIKKLGLKLSRFPGFNIGKPKVAPCNYKNNVLVTAHGLSPNELRTVWNGICTEHLQ